MNQKGSVNLALVAVTIVLVGVIAYLLLAQKPAPVAVTPALTPTLTPVLTLTSTPSPTPFDETADWKVIRMIRSEKDGYEFRYPENFGANVWKPLFWPPRATVVSVTEDPLKKGCSEFPAGIQGATESKVKINDINYTFYRASEGAAGTNYTNYCYTTQQDRNYYALYFVIRSASGCGTNCGAYCGTSYEEECRNLDRVKDVEKPIENIVATFKFISDDPLVSKVKVFFINTGVPNHDGPVGCGDEAVGLDRTITPTTAPLKAALENLLSTSQASLEGAGLYNALAKQNWKLESVSIANTEAVIKFSGQYVGLGVCEDPRIKAQIEKTALQFSTVKKVSIFVNGVSLDKLTSGRGE